MITCKDQYVLTNAKNYFREHLCAGDCYSESKQISGQWYEAGAQILGLSEGI